MKKPIVLLLVLVGCWLAIRIQDPLSIEDPGDWEFKLPAQTCAYHECGQPAVGTPRFLARTGKTMRIGTGKQAYTAAETHYLVVPLCSQHVRYHQEGRWPVAGPDALARWVTFLLYAGIISLTLVAVGGLLTKTPRPQTE